MADDADETNAWWNDAFMLAARRLKRSAAKAEGAPVSAAEQRAKLVVDPLCPLYSRFHRATDTAPQHKKQAVVYIFSKIFFKYLVGAII